jgi:hypothetical protein
MEENQLEWDYCQVAHCYELHSPDIFVILMLVAELTVGSGGKGCFGL